MNTFPAIDLHLHSSFSDGTYTPAEIVAEAREKGMDLIALTDHNTLAGADEFRHAALEAGQPALIGVEMTSSYSMTDPHEPEIHVLGYFPLQADLTADCFDDLHDVIRRFAANKFIQNEAIINNIAADHPQLSVPEFYEYVRTIKSDTNYNRVHIANYLVHKGLAVSVKDSFNRFIGDDCKYYVTKEKISVAEVVRAIKKAGGTSVIAHPAEYHFDEEKLRGFFKYCYDLCTDGIEVFHPSNSEDDISLILRLIEEVTAEGEGDHSFLISTGSDFHGKNKVNTIGEGSFFDIRKSKHFEQFIEACRQMHAHLHA